MKRLIQHIRVRAFVCAIVLIAYGGTPVSAAAAQVGPAGVSIAEDSTYTPVPTDINEDLVLTADQSPYLAGTDVYVGGEGSLTIEAGVIIYAAPDVGFTVFGGFSAAGTVEQPVTFAAAVPDSPWSGIMVSSWADTARYEHVHISGVSGNVTACRAQYCPVIYRHVTIDCGASAIIQEGGSAVIESCSFPAALTHDVISIKGNATVVISNTEIAGGEGSESDAIDLEAVASARIEDCLVRSSGDDGIDVGNSSKDVVITGTRLFECHDKGISVGQGSSAEIAGCVIAYADEGVTVFGGATVDIDRTTIAGGRFGLVARSGDDGFNGTADGLATIRNTIFSGMAEMSVTVEPGSSISKEYCLTEDILLEGTGNVLGDARLRDPASFDFRLHSDSDAIDAASSELGHDPDGSRREIGAVPFESRPLVITEINYCAADSLDTGDWVELYNPGPDTVDVAGWVFIDSNEDHRYEFPDDLAVPPDAYLVIARDRNAFAGYYPGIEPLPDEVGFGLSPDGELIRLIDGRDVVIDSLTYGSVAPWPVAPNGTGATLALIDYAADNADPRNWAASPDLGTPGEPNVIPTAVEQPDNDTPQPFILGPAYPNPFNPATTIPLTIDRAAPVNLAVYSLTGQRVSVLLDRFMVPGEYRVSFTPENLGAGCYFVVLSAGGFRQSIPVMYVK